MDIVIYVVIDQPYWYHMMITSTAIQQYLTDSMHIWWGRFIQELDDYQ